MGQEYSLVFKEGSAADLELKLLMKRTCLTKEQLLIKLLGVALSVVRLQPRVLGSGNWEVEVNVRERS